MNNDIAGVLDRVDGDLCNSLDRLFSLLRIESVSTDPAYAQACREAARWLGDDLAAMGFEAAVRETPGHPMVVGHYTPPGGAAAPHVLFYGITTSSRLIRSTSGRSRRSSRGSRMRPAARRKSARAELAMTRAS